MKQLISAVLLAGLVLISGLSIVRALDEPHKYWANFSNSGALKDQNFFPLGVWAQPTHQINAYKDAGINLYVSGESSLTFPTTCRAYGMKCIMHQTDDVLGMIANFKDVIIGWGHQDEPDNAQPDGSGGYDPCVSPSVIQSLYNGWKAKDPTRPVYLNFGQGVSYIDWVGRGTCTGQWQMYREYIKGCDFPCYDIYPVNSKYSAVQGKLWYVPKGVDSLESWSDHKKPVWTYIECTDISDGGGRKPTVAEVKAEIWQSIIHGADGILYFCHSFASGSSNDDAVLDDPTMTAGITAINSRITSLAAVINSPTVTGRVTCNAGNVDIMVKEYNGDLFIFAAEMEGKTASPTFTVTSPPKSSVEVLDENRTLSVGSSFSDAFSVWGVHLYHIGDNWSSGIGDLFANQPVQAPAIHVTRNPVRTGTQILVTDMAGSKEAGLAVYTTSGELVKTLELTQGKAAWDGCDLNGKKVSTGIYQVLISGDHGSAVYPIAVVK